MHFTEVIEVAEDQAPTPVVRKGESAADLERRLDWRRAAGLIPPPQPAVLWWGGERLLFCRGAA